MNTKSRRFSWLNAFGLVTALPFVLRMTWEATVLRLSQGPQMLGFTVMHAADGALGALVFVSMSFAFAYVVFALLSLALFLLPSVRAGYAGVRSIALGLTLVVGHATLGDLLQRELPPALLAMGMVGILAIPLAMGRVSYLGFRPDALRTRSAPAP